MKILNKDTIIMCVYGIYNREKKKIYVGSTLNFNKRKAQHMRLLTTHKHSNKELQNDYKDINTYEFLILKDINIDDFNCNLIKINEHLGYMEYKYITKTKSYDIRYGYNKKITKSKVGFKKDYIFSGDIEFDLDEEFLKKDYYDNFFGNLDEE